MHARRQRPPALRILFHKRIYNITNWRAKPQTELSRWTVLVPATIRPKRNKRITYQWLSFPFIFLLMETFSVGRAVSRDAFFPRLKSHFRVVQWLALSNSSRAAALLHATVRSLCLINGRAARTCALQSMIIFQQTVVCLPHISPLYLFVLWVFKRIRKIIQFA